MKWIDTADLRNWANRRDCQESLPLLVRKLIRATSTSIENIKFPSGENVLIGGWDGILQVKTGTEYIPSGTSLWEFGANSDVKGKADDDYAKRTTDPIGFNPAESTFIFVTPRLWTKADEWIAEKKKDGIWKDIKVINAEKLEEWLETAPTVGAWLSIQHFGKYPAPVQSVEDFWDEWSTGKNIQLNHQLLLGGRENEVKKIIKLSEKPLVIPVQSLTREEALNFIISALKNNPEEEEDFNARTLIIGDVETFRKVSINANPLILIPRFEDEGIFNKAVSKGHTVIVPLGIDSSESWNGKILLPPIERESFVNSLVQSGIKKDIAEKYSKESARNITILRRQLEFKRNIPEWAKPENVRDIIPALIVGRWDENYEKDKEIVAKIAGVSYDEYSKKLKRWQFSSDSPIVKIGSKWRLASPLDSWTNASKFLTQNDFVLLQDSFLEILNEINPAFELEPKERYMASFHGKNRQYSSWIREGITQSLILVSVFGSKLSFDLPVSGISGEVWVDTIVSKLLDTDNPFLWKSTEGVLPLIAEASPREFLNKVDKYLNIDKSPVAALFEEEPGFLSNHSYHTGLLWALENLAWMPEYLTRSALVLAKLAFIDPDGNLSNRPKNSLTEIFKPWHYQTLAKLETRLETLKLITEKEKDVAWNLLLGMIPSFNGVGFPTHQMRWRLFNESTRLQYFYDEIDRTHTTVIDLLISIFDYTEEKLADLVDKSDEIRLSYENREKMRAFIQSVSEKVERKENKVWKAIGKVLSSHRSISDAQWALPETELIKYDELYKLFEPTDEIEKNVWLFEENWPSFPEGLKRKDVPYDEIQKIIDEKRIEAIKKIHRKYGVEKAKELSKQVKEDWIFGKTLAHIIDKENEVLSICQMLKDEKNNLRFFYGFISEKAYINGNGWVFDLILQLKEKGYNNSDLAQLLIPLRQNNELWDFIDAADKEVRDEYWKSVYPHFYGVSPEEKIRGIKYLLEYNRFRSAVNIASLMDKELPTELIAELLEANATKKSSETTGFHGYEVEHLFSTLDERKDINEEQLVRLEWLNLSILSSVNSSRKPKLLHKELSKKPEFFMEVLKCIYIPGDEKEMEAVKGNLTDEQLADRAKYAYNLLELWKEIPGMKEDKTIDTEFLNSWVDNSRKLAKEYGRLEAADINIGHVLAQYPEKSEVWPPDEICEVIERINTDELKRNFSSSIFNNYGSSTKAHNEGGEREWKLAEYFKKLADNHRNKHPNVALILDNLSKSYERDAKREDERAERRVLEY